MRRNPRIDDGHADPMARQAARTRKAAPHLIRPRRFGRDGHHARDGNVARQMRDRFVLAQGIELRARRLENRAPSEPSLDARTGASGDRIYC
jgi:hypothetical protein